jgi:hypothetical protein
VDWHVDGEEALRIAKEKQRMLLVMHLSGDLEDRTRL